MFDDFYDLSDDVGYNYKRVRRSSLGITTLHLGVHAGHCSYLSNIV